MAIGQEIYLQNFISPDSVQYFNHCKNEGQFGVLQGSRILLLPRFVRGKEIPQPLRRQWEWYLSKACWIGCWGSVFGVWSDPVPSARFAVPGQLRALATWQDHSPGEEDGALPGPGAILRFPARGMSPFFSHSALPCF
ncbi:heparan-alpha-glucosaminide N-acetyltransferase [Platysternon megacephalum]|uniref:Heparan-alpha-glucosaminide N-acetyltransferase n=1 Tax=Platysternon megacephalum TaxID=55544 RepID=A0A4D9EF03_9SAUR|nr:heparan-alpha-glucosaminide N-acetyltransferase [Platysternon megacephalum]